MTITYYTQVEVAERLGLTKQRVNAMTRDGLLRTVEPISGAVRITARELARFERLDRRPGRPKKER